MKRRTQTVNWTWRSILLLILFLLLAWALREFAGIDLLGGGGGSRTPSPGTGSPSTSPLPTIPMTLPSIPAAWTCIWWT
jgi:hypothetical protein